MTIRCFFYCLNFSIVYISIFGSSLGHASHEPLSVPKLLYENHERDAFMGRLKTHGTHALNLSPVLASFL